MAKVRGVLVFFCLASLLALAFMISSSLGEQLSNDYLGKRMYVNALLSYDVAGWLADWATAFLLFVFSWIAAGVLSSIFSGRSRALNLLVAFSASLLTVTFIASSVFDYRAGGLGLVAFGFQASSVLVACSLFVVGLFPKPSDRLLAWAVGRSGWLVAVSTAALILPAAAGAAKLTQGRIPDGPSVLLISIDTLRADHLGCYGYRKELTPNIDEFAADSLLFVNAIAPSPWTIPSHVSMLTGYFPSSIGVRTYEDKIPAAIDSLAELLKEKGYLTASFNGGGLVSSIYGFAQGFDIYWSISTSFGQIPNEIERIDEKVMEYLGKIERRKFFIFYHTYQVHTPYWVHEGFSEPEAKTCRAHYADPHHRVEPLPYCHLSYEGEVKYMDYHIGRLFDFLKESGLYDDTLIIFTSDHGEAFIDDERGMTGHAYKLYDELIRVPLIVKFPNGVFGGRVIDAQVRLQDVVPTVLDVLKIGGFAGQGKSLMPLVKGGESTGLEAMSEFYPLPNPTIDIHFPGLNTQKLSFRRPDVKLIVDLSKRSSELYDLEADPKERANLLSGPAPGAYPRGLEMFAALIRAIEENALEHPGVDGGERAGMTPELREQLKALGYIQ